MTTNSTTDFRIESHERGGGLQSIQPSMPDVADDLRGILRDMEALLHVANGEGSERLGIEPDADPADAVPAWIDSWALDVHASDSRVTILLATGGPHIELDILTLPSAERRRYKQHKRHSDSSYVDAVEEVSLRRSWPPAYDRAWTTDDRALGIAGYFLDLIGRL